MNQKFIKYDWEQLLDEKLFISWILRDENSNEWEKIIAENPKFAKEAETAREIVMLLEDKFEVIDENSIASMWKNIEQFDQKTQQSSRRIRIQNILGWAASILLLMSIGSFAYYYFSEVNDDYQFTATIQPGEEDAHVVLSTGEKISLNRENSRIKLDKEEQQLIVNDSIIHMAPTQKEKVNVVMNEVVMPYGKQTELILADGSVIWLNAGSKLAFPSAFTKNSREVYLEGEAAFKIAKDESKPFIVKTAGGLDIRVLGTYFNVSAYSDQETVETVLIEGSVSLNKTGKFKKMSVELNPYEKAEFNKTDNEIQVSFEPNAERYVAWVKGWLEYRRESLNSVLVKLERYYDVKFHLPSNFPADDRISGKLDLKESLENVMIVLADAAQIEFKINGKEVFIQRKNQ